MEQVKQDISAYKLYPEGLIKEVVEAMCDNYCKYTDNLYTEDQRDRICLNCPLNRLEV